MPEPISPTVFAPNVSPISSTPRAPSWIPRRRRMLSLTVMCATLVAVGDVLFYRQPIGLTPAIFGMLLTVAILAYRSHALLHWPGRLIVLGIAGLCIALIEHPGPLRIMLVTI